jgi:flagellar hook protein FlgE
MDLTSLGLAALQSAASGIQGHAARVARPVSLDPTAPEVPEADLATEFIAIKVDSLGYKAGLKILQVADEQLGQALDLKA